MKIKLLAVLLLLCSAVNSTTVINDKVDASSFEKADSIEINPKIFDFWW